MKPEADSKHREHYEDKTVLITGGAGAIGSNLTRAIASLGAKTVIVLDDMSAAYSWNLPDLPNVLHIQGSVVDEAALKRVFGETPHLVFHLAAFFANQNSVDYPERDLEVNGLGTLRVLEYAAMRPLDRFVYASSGCSIYGSQAPLPLREDFTSMHLTTPYQITKMLGELYANFFWHHHDLPIVKTRFFNSYGPREVPGQYRNVIPNFIYWAMSGKPLLYTGTGDETRDFTYVEDIVEALLATGYREEVVGEEINIASGVETNILELAHMINEITGNQAGVHKAQRRVWDTKKRLRASIERASDLIDYRPSTTFEDGLKTTVMWFESNWDRIQVDAEFPPGMSSATRPLDEPQA